MKAMAVVNDIGDGRNKDRNTFFQKSGRKRIRVRLHVRTVEKNLRNFKFRCRPERRITDRCCCRLEKTVIVGTKRIAGM